jgi:DNA-binding CsgD family transcriptional regulator
LELLRQDGHIIDKVIVLYATTSDGYIADAVLSLRHIFDCPPYANSIKLESIAVTENNGTPFIDEDAPQSIEGIFHSLYRCIWQEKQQNHQIHLSLAGGCKALSVFAMVTAQLLFDDGDYLWHLYAGKDFLTGNQIVPSETDHTHLIPIPVLLRSFISPALTDLRDISDPYEALEQIRRQDMGKKLRQGHDFVMQRLTKSEERVVALLVKEGLSSAEIASRQNISKRTVENHLSMVCQKAAAHWSMPSVNRMQLITLLWLFYSMTSTV